MFNFIAVCSFDFNLVEIQLNILLHAVVGYLKRFKALEIMIVQIHRFFLLFISKCKTL